jgi:predicted RNA-binding Zn-ribbon protein involved in translation (DUF1610 family)
MGLRGQLLELRNEGRYQFLLRVGVYDDILPGHPSLTDSEGAEEEGLPVDKAILVYECRLDFSDADKPVSYPLGDLAACMEVYEGYETPENLPAEKERSWKIAFIVDTVIAETFSTDVLEVIHGDDYEQDDLEEAGAWQENRPARPEEIAAPPASGAGFPVRCPDCGAEVKAIANTDKRKVNTYACEICGRYFAV